jgi:hypothetical protein
MIYSNGILIELSFPLLQEHIFDEERLGEVRRFRGIESSQEYRRVRCDADWYSLLCKYFMIRFLLF